MKEKFKKMADKFLNNTEESMVTIMQELQTEEAEQIQCNVCACLIEETEDYVIPAILQNSNVLFLNNHFLVPLLVPDYNPSVVSIRPRV